MSVQCEDADGLVADNQFCHADLVQCGRRKARVRYERDFRRCTWLASRALWTNFAADALRSTFALRASFAAGADRSGDTLGSCVTFVAFRSYEPHRATFALGAWGAWGALWASCPLWALWANLTRRPRLAMRPCLATWPLWAGVAALTRWSGGPHWTNQSLGARFATGAWVATFATLALWALCASSADRTNRALYARLATFAPWPSDALRPSRANLSALPIGAPHNTQVYAHAVRQRDNQSAVVVGREREDADPRGAIVAARTAGASHALRPRLTRQSLHALQGVHCD